MWQGIVSIVAVVFGFAGTAFGVIYANVKLSKTTQHQQFKDFMAAYGKYSKTRSLTDSVEVFKTLNIAKLGASTAILNDIRKFESLLSADTIDRLALNTQFEKLIDTINSHLFRKLNSKN